jgi:Tol biopolymer transport system component
MTPGPPLDLRRRGVYGRPIRCPIASPACAALALLTTTVVAALLPAPAGATPPGRDGRIAYMLKDPAGHWQIWVSRSRLRNAEQLTRGDYDSGWAVWSPNGKHLAFDSNRAHHAPNSKHVNDIFVMRPDGSGVEKLTNSRAASGDAAWSPDGRLIAFDSDRGNREGYNAIYVMNANGGKIRRITKPAPPLSDYEPRFSPDGAQLVFSRARGTAENAPAAVFTVHLDGKGLHQLTSYSLRVGATDWSPDGSRIVFEGYPNGPYGDIYVVDASGGAPANVTHDTTGQADPVWSPDGQRILFLDNGFVNGVGRTGLAIMSPNGSNRHFISSKNAEAHQPDWESVRG